MINKIIIYIKSLGFLSALLLYTLAFSELNDNKLSPINRNDILKPPQLLKPHNKKILSTLSPTFRWHKIKGNDIEYRLLVAESNGKIIMDKWMGSDTSYVVSDPKIFRDLSVYLWSVSAYRNSDHKQSIPKSFCIDLNVSSDLEVRNLKLISDKQSWHPGEYVTIEVEVLNCGTVTCFDSKLLLCNGKINPNYFRSFDMKRSTITDSTIIEQLDAGESEKVILSGKVTEGYNHFYAMVKTRQGIKDIFLRNNSKSGPIIQTIPAKWQLRGLFVIYTNYNDPKKRIKRINKTKLSQIYQNIVRSTQYFWDHTRILDIKVDTLHISRVLTDDDFSYIDDNWGLVLGPWDIERDLEQRGIGNDEYDFIFVYYAWSNSVYSWSGYLGYSYGVIENILGQTAFAAQPILFEKEGDEEEVTIHEILHMIDHLYEKSGDSKFFSPDEKELHTTFTVDLDYYEWILETWPAKKWFNLDWGRKIVASKATNHAADRIPKNLSLGQNYPNPFNNSTKITYELPANNSPRNEYDINLKIYNLLGECVCTLVDETKKPGIYSVIWNGVTDSGRSVSSGIYFYKLSVGDQSLIKKLLFIR